MSLVDRQNEFLTDMAKLIDHVQESGWKVTGGELFRTKEQQEMYLKSGKSQTMDSLHRKRLAIDLFFFEPDGESFTICWKKEKLAPFGDYWESLRDGNRWGGNFKGFVDVPHFQGPGSKDKGKSERPV